MKQTEEHKKLTSKLNIALVLIGIAAIAAAVVVFLTVPGDLQSQFLEHGWHARGADIPNGPYPFIHGGRHPGFGLVVLVVLAVIFIAGMRHRMAAFHMFHTHHRGDSAMEILRKEYATGDISKEEYLSRKEVLEKGEGGEE